MTFKNNLTDGRMTRILAGMKPLCELLSEWRKTIRLTPSEAARRCGISPQLWYQLETGETRNPRTATIYKIAAGTGIPVERLAAASYFDPAAVPALSS